MKEIFVDIIGYEGLYQVSNYGRVKSLERIDSLGRHRREKILKEIISCNGHLYVNLFKNGVIKIYYIHILVAKHFIPNPEGKSDVHHKDHNPANNNVDNLVWLTKKEHAKEHPEKYEACGRGARKVKSKHINQFTRDGLFLRAWYSSYDIQRELGFFQSNIIQCCKGNKNYSHAYGFIWKYAEDC